MCKTVGYSSLFYSFFKIGTFTIGGGYAMIPMMEDIIVNKRQWLGKEEFMDVMSISQAMPGVFAVNMATNIGYKLKGVRGSVVAVLGNILVPVLIILLLAACFRHFRENQVVEAIFKGLRPAVVALIAAPVFGMAKTARISWRNVWIPILSALLIWLLGVSPVLVILVAVAAGFVYGRLLSRKEGSQ
ncbi:MAG: chromate transporter [Bacteroidales bacterium]|nr:chromate transporter [Bacteroidales bacterium]